MQSEEIRTFGTLRHFSFLSYIYRFGLFLSLAKGLELCHCVGAHFYLLLLDTEALCVETF